MQNLYMQKLGQRVLLRFQLPNDKPIWKIKEFRDRKCTMMRRVECHQCPAERQMHADGRTPFMKSSGLHSKIRTLQPNNCKFK